MSFWKLKKDKTKELKAKPQIFKAEDSKPEVSKVEGQTTEVFFQEEDILTSVMKNSPEIDNGSNHYPKTVNQSQEKTMDSSDYKFPQTTETHTLPVQQRQSPKGANLQKPILPPYKSTIEKKLTILLVENTLEMEKWRSILNNKVRKTIKDGLVCCIYYGSIVWQSAIVEVSAIENIPLFIEQELGEKACLYDALIHVASLVTQKYQVVEEQRNNKIMVSDIEIIGIGTCKDNISSIQKDFAINCFTKVSQKPQVLSKYYCITEQGFIEAAQIGFRTIGAISKKY